MTDPAPPPFARALGRIPSGLFVLTAGRLGATCTTGATGILASFVQQVGFEPPTVMVAIRRGRHAMHLVRETGGFCLSILPEDGKVLLGHFVRGFDLGEPAFEGLDVGATKEGIPYLKGAAAWLGCQVSAEVDGGDHMVFVAEVIEGEQLTDKAPWVHLRKNGLSY